MKPATTTNGHKRRQPKQDRSLCAFEGCNEKRLSYNSYCQEHRRQYAKDWWRRKDERLEARLAAMGTPAIPEIPDDGKMREYVFKRPSEEYWNEWVELDNKICTLTEALNYGDELSDKHVCQVEVFVVEVCQE